MLQLPILSIQFLNPGEEDLGLHYMFCIPFQHLLVALYTAVKFEVNCGDKLAAKTAAMEGRKSGTSAADTDLSSDEQQQQPSSKKSRLATKEIAPPGDGQAQR